MTSLLAPPGRRPLARHTGGIRPARTLRSLGRAATGLACGALADVGEMLVVSLLTAGAAAAAACALASLAIWVAKALAALVVRGPAQAFARRRASVQAASVASEHIAGTLHTRDGT